MPSLTIKGNKKYINRMFIHLKQEHPTTRTRMSKQKNGFSLHQCDPLKPSFNKPPVVGLSAGGTNSFFQPLTHGDLNFLFNKHKIPGIVLREAREKKQVVFGAQAMNKQLPLGLQRNTQDYDLLTKNPKRQANSMQRKLDNEVSGGRDEFYNKQAIHPGTHRVVHQGKDGIKRTEDDVVVIDYSRATKTNVPPAVIIDGIRYQTLPSIEEGKRKTLKDKKSEFRHEKDREDLERIKFSKVLRGGFE